MLSTIVLCDTASRSSHIELAELFARSLSSLIAANIEGLLGDVAIAGPEGRDLGWIADEAGCAAIEAASENEWLRRAIEAARGPGVFILLTGFAPQAGFVEEAADFLRRREGRPDSAALLRAAPEGLLQRLWPSLAPTAGLIAPRRACLAKSTASFAGLVRAFGDALALQTPARRIG